MFPKARSQGVQAAMPIQRELTADDVHARIGVHVGEVIVEPERLTGDAVNIFARRCRYARAAHRSRPRHRLASVRASPRAGLGVDQVGNRV